MKITFYGASITQQKGALGYVDNFKSIASNYEVTSYGYGGNCIEDVGWYCLDHVINDGPKICFIEFATTFLTSFSDRFHRILNELLANNILPINLILPNKNNISGLECIDQIHAAQKNYGIPFLDLRNAYANRVQDTDFLRDGVHTQEVAAKEYASSILTYLNNFLIWLN